MSPRSSARGVLLGHMLRAPCEQSLKWKQGQQMPLNKLQEKINPRKQFAVSGCVTALCVSHGGRVTDVF